MSSRIRAAVIACIGAAATLMLAPTRVSAHETRSIGDIVAVVGFGTEPSFVGQVNSALISLSDERNGEPIVEGVDLQVEIGFGEERLALEMEPSFVVGVFGEAGTYEAFFLPTRAGTYEFHFTGTIGDIEFDETFTSGPDTFGPMEDPAAISFPARDPSSAELAGLVDRELARQADDVKSARLIAFIGLGVGAVALLAALGASRAARKR